MARPTAERPSLGRSSHESDIYYAYRLILRRDPDPAGLDHFRQRVRAGLPLPETINNLLLSDEFHDRMEASRLSELRRVDLAGYELLVLRGLSRLIARHRPALLVEFNPACLAVQQQDRLAYLQLIFDLHPRVRAISHFGDDETFGRTEGLMTFWTKRSSELASGGALGGGSLHFDLVAARA